MLQLQWQEPLLQVMLTPHRKSSRDETAETTIDSRDSQKETLAMREAANSDLIATPGTDDTTATYNAPISPSEHHDHSRSTTHSRHDHKKYLTRLPRMIAWTSCPRHRTEWVQASHTRTILWNPSCASGFFWKTNNWHSPRQQHKTVHNTQLQATRLPRTMISACKDWFRSRCMHHTCNKMCQAVSQGCWQWRPSHQNVLWSRSMYGRPQCRRLPCTRLPNLAHPKYSKGI